MSKLSGFPGQDQSRRAPSPAAPHSLALPGPESVLELLHPFFRNQEKEHLRALFLDADGRLCGMGAWTGEQDIIDFPIRRILASALAADASGIILAHNHPSGDPNPSARDVRTSRTIARICTAIDITLIDHVIISGEKLTSMRALRLI